MPLLPLLAAISLQAADTVRVVLVATTDVHGYITDWNYPENIAWPGGLVRAATVIDSLRDRYPGQVVVVDAGDALQGSPLASYFAQVAPRDPHPAIEAMSLLAYDAATPGDHDFDFGLESFNRALTGSTFPWVSGNLRALPRDTLALPPYTVVTRNGVRVAITGFTTPAVMVANGDKLQGRLRAAPVESAAAGLLPEMRKDADLTVVLAHTGLAGGSSYDTTGIGPEHAAARLAAGAAKPDLVIVGHSHAEVRDTVIGGVHFVQPGPRARMLAVVHVALVPRAARLVPVRYRAEQVSLEEVRPSTRVARRLADPHATLLRWVSTVLGEAERSMPLAAARAEDTPLQRFILDLERRAARADLAAAPVLDPRAGFDAGEITQAELLRVYPEDYTLRAVRISGAQLRSFLEQSARYYYADSTGRVAPNRFVDGANYEVVAGARYTIDLTRPMGSRIAELSVGGRPVAPTDSFTLALSSYRQRGAGNYRMLAGAPVVYDQGESIRDLIAAEIGRRHTLRPQDFGAVEWRIVPEDRARKARAIFVRETAPVAAADPGPPPRVLPARKSRAEQEREDSLQRERDKAEALARAIVATLKLPAEPGADRGLGRLLADAYRNALRADVAIVDGREVGRTLPAGGLTTGDIAAGAPGEDRLLSITLTGAELEDVLEHVVESGGPCCELAGLRVEFDPRAKPLDRVKRVRLTNDASIDRKRKYLVAISQRLVDGDSVFTLGATDCRPGKGCKTAGRLDRWKVERSELLPAAVLRDYLRRLPQPASPPADPRLISSR